MTATRTRTETRTKPRKAPNALHIRPLADRIVLRRLERNEATRGGIVIPDTAKEKPQQAEVIAVGPGRVDRDGGRIPSALRSRDRVLIGKYAGTDVEIDGNDYVIVREEDVLGILED